MKFSKNILKKVSLIAMAVMLVGGVVGCSNKESSKEGNAETKKMELKYAKGFSVEYLEDGIKKVIDADNRELILIPKKMEVPDKYKNAKIVRTPVDKVLVGSTTQACSLRVIDELKSIKAVTTDADFWTIDEVKNGVKSGKIKYVGANTAPDYEKIADLNPDLAIVYSGSSDADAKLIDKLDELGITYVVDNEYKEEDPFGRMEWSKLIGAFYDKEDIASKSLDNVVKNVEEATKKIKNNKKAKVVWASVYEGTVYVPKKDSYVDKMIKMAGAENVFDNMDVDGGQISIEQLHEAAKNADIFVYSSSSAYSPDLKSIIDKAPVLGDLDVIKNGNLWVFAPDYYQSVDKTDELITDLIEMFNPGTTGQDIKHYINYKK